jgi:hypothetical protein
MRCRRCGRDTGAKTALCDDCGTPLSEAMDGMPGALPQAEMLERTGEEPLAMSPSHSRDILVGGVFVGRQPEMQALRAALEDALARRGGVVMLVGEPGIGQDPYRRQGGGFYDRVTGEWGLTSVHEQRVASEKQPTAGEPSPTLRRW